MLFGVVVRVANLEKLGNNMRETEPSVAKHHAMVATCVLLDVGWLQATLVVSLGQAVLMLLESLANKIRVDLTDIVAGVALGKRLRCLARCGVVRLWVLPDNLQL
jgi:hypothetical protein